MTAINVSAAARNTDIAQGQLQDARSANHGVAYGVLCLAHAPDDAGRFALGHGLGSKQNHVPGHAGDLQDLFRRPLGQRLFLDLVHAINTGLDVFLVFPAILENVMQHSHQEGNIGARAQPHILVGLGRGAREARVADDDLGTRLLGM